eukprot:5082979-Prymnesium_polylepis.1
MPTTTMLRVRFFLLAAFCLLLAAGCGHVLRAALAAPSGGHPRQGRHARRLLAADRRRVVLHPAATLERNGAVRCVPQHDGAVRGVDRHHVGGERAIHGAAGTVHAHAGAA